MQTEEIDIQSRLKNLSEEDKNMLANNVDILYAYLDMSIDSMMKEELMLWISLLKEIDPNFEK